MNFELTNSFKKKAKKLCLKNPRLKSTLIKQFNIFGTNPQHPSLKLHRLQGNRSVQFAMWVANDLRAIAIKSEDKFIFFDLISHDKY